MTTLAETISRRLRAAGLEDDPALEQVQQWNHEAKVAAELDPARAGHRNWTQAHSRKQAPR